MRAVHREPRSVHRAFRCHADDAEAFAAKQICNLGRAVTLKYDLCAFDPAATGQRLFALPSCQQVTS